MKNKFTLKRHKSTKNKDAFVDQNLLKSEIENQDQTDLVLIKKLNKEANKSQKLNTINGNNCSQTNQTQQKSFYHNSQTSEIESQNSIVKSKETQIKPEMTPLGDKVIPEVFPQCQSFDLKTEIKTNYEMSFN